MTYQGYLKKYNLVINKFYDCSFQLDSIYQDKEEINKVSFEIIDGISPCVIVHCYNNEKWIGCFGSMNPEIITDKYDRQSIIDNFLEAKDGEDYNIKNFSKILKFIKLEYIQQVAQ